MQNGFGNSVPLRFFPSIHLTKSFPEMGSELTFTVFWGSPLPGGMYMISRTISPTFFKDSLVTRCKIGNHKYDNVNKERVVFLI